MKNFLKKWIFSFSAILFGLLSGHVYLNYFIGPGTVDFYFRGNNYQKIADIMLLPDFNNINGIQYNVLYFNDRTSCSMKKTKGNGICPAQYDELLNTVLQTRIPDINSDVVRGIVKFKHFGGDLEMGPGIDYFNYIYSKKGFSLEEKQARHVIKVMNDYWIITSGSISTPANIK